MSYIRQHHHRSRAGPSQCLVGSEWYHQWYAPLWPNYQFYPLAETNRIETVDRREADRIS